MTVFDRVDPKALSIVMFIIIFLCIFAIMVCIAFLFEKGHRKLLLILGIIASLAVLAGCVLFLLWFK